jgi:hypothetical protein
MSPSLPTMGSSGDPPSTFSVAPPLPTGIVLNLSTGHICRFLRAQPYP